MAVAKLEGIQGIETDCLSLYLSPHYYKTRCCNIASSSCISAL